MSSPAVTVVIPAHNRLPLLREALDSVQAQTFRNYEVIVVDDASDPPLAPALLDHPLHPSVLRQAQRRGPAAARNRGIGEARAPLVAFLDSDDLWLPDKLTRYVAAIDAEHDPCVFFGPMLPIDSGGAIVAGRTKPRCGGWITNPLFRSCFVDVPTVVCQKKMLQDAGGFNESLPVCEDYDLWLRLSVAHRFVLIDEPLAKRRLHDDRLSKSSMSRNLAVKARMLARFYESNRSSGKLDDRAASRRLARVYFLAARAAFHEGLYSQAAELCRTSRCYGRPPLRAIPLALAAAALARFDRKAVTSST